MMTSRATALLYYELHGRCLAQIDLAPRTQSHLTHILSFFFSMKQMFYEK